MSYELFYMEPADSPAKRSILKEGLRLFADRGLSATSIRDIASATGYSNPALYKHFKTKEDLALLLFERSYRELLNRLTIATRDKTGFSDQFRAYIHANTRFYDDHPHAAIFISDNLAVLWPKVSENIRGRTIITLTRDLLKKGRKEGLVAKDPDISLQLMLVTGMLGQMTRQLYLHAFDGPAVKHAEGIERVLLSGLS